MANYIISQFNTGLMTAAEAALALETKLEDMDSTAHPVVGTGVCLTRRDRDQAIGWLLYTGYDVLFSMDMDAAHAVGSDSMTITTNP